MTHTKEDLHAFLRTRRSIRRFKPDPVPDSVISDILLTATYAPTAHNLQPSRFAIVMDPHSKEQLGETLTSSMRADMQAQNASQTEIEERVARSIKRINEAPVVILLCRDTSAVRESRTQDTVMSIQSAAATSLQLLLAAHAEGVGGNWICWPLYAQEQTRMALSLPETWEPQAMIFLGYPVEIPEAKERKDLKEIVKTFKSANV